MSEEKKRFKSLNIEGSKYYTYLTNKFENREKWEKPNEKTIKSYIPGKIVKIDVKEGQKVKNGDTLFILEAMKMKNKIVAPFNGTILKVHVKKNENVPKNKLIVEFK